MPWHKVRVYYDREAERERRFAYRMSLSVLLAAALLVLMAGVVMYPFVELWSMPSSQGAAMNEWRAAHGSPDFPTATQEVCGVVALLCLAYLSIGLNARTK
jgi:hypothetical protein